MLQIVGYTRNLSVILKILHPIAKYFVISTILAYTESLGNFGTFGKFYDS